MAIRNNKLGGNDYVNGEVLEDFDLDDTNNAIVSLIPKDLTKLGVDTYTFSESTSLNTFDTRIGEFLFKTAQDASFNWESDISSLLFKDVNSTKLNYEYLTLETGDGISYILDNFDDATTPSFFTETGTGSGTETDGYYQLALSVGDGENQTLQSISGDIKNTEGVFMIPIFASGFGQEFNSHGYNRIYIGSDTDATWTPMYVFNVNGSNSANEDAILVFEILSNVVTWRVLVDGIQTDSGEVDLSTATDINLRLYTEVEGGGSQDDANSALRLYGIYRLKSSITSTLNFEMSNDGGSTYANISESGYVEFASPDKQMKLKISGAVADNEAILINFNPKIERLS